MSALWRHSMGQGAGGTQYMWGQNNKNFLRIENVKSHDMKKRKLDILVQNEHILGFVMVEVLLCFVLR
jgi:hypothetical protein